jgi:hypothetical protein
MIWYSTVTMSSPTTPTTLPAYLLDEQYSDSEFAQPYFQQKQRRTHHRKMTTLLNAEFTLRLPQSQQYLVRDISGTFIATFLKRNSRTSIEFRGIDASKTSTSSRINAAASVIEWEPPTPPARRYQEDPEVLAAIERLLESVDTSVGFGSR